MIEIEEIKYEALSFDRIRETNCVRLPCGDIRHAEWNDNDDVLYFRFAGGVNPFTQSALIREQIQILKSKPVEFDGVCDGGEHGKESSRLYISISADDAKKLGGIKIGSRYKLVQITEEAN